MCGQMCRLPTHSLLCFRFGIPLPDTGKLLKGRYAEEESCNTGGHQYDDGDDSGLRVKMCVWLGVSRGLDLAFLNAD